MRFRPGYLIAIAAVTASLAGPVQAQRSLETGLAGSYLAARSAAFSGDHLAAAEYFEQALAVDPDNTLLVGNAIFAWAAVGNWTRAGEIAVTMPADGPGRELANLALMVDALREADFAAAADLIANGNGAGPFIDGLSMGWISLGQGEMDEAVAQFETVAQDRPLRDLAYTHLGYARAAVGDFEGADAILSGEAFGPVTMTERTIRARAEILAQLDRDDEALELLDRYTSAVPDPSLLALQARLTEGSGGPYAFITRPEQGVAEVFFSVARALGADGGSSTLPLLYAQAARGIDPANSAASMFAGRLFFEDQQFELAAEVYDSIPAGSDDYVEGQLGRADAIFDNGLEDDGIAVLQNLAEQRPDLPTVHGALGDMLRRSENCEAAIDAYSAAIDLLDTTQESAWFIFYTRAICYEQMDDWPPAEADFRQALVLNPEQPNVLNYLGYSLVEQRRSLDEALDMIERAVARRPDSGYITDSLGWVLYRLGRFEEAVEPMERAVALEPNDPIINDHLGDVYWMVGRYREAEFQWHRALSFEPEEAEAERIRLKLDVGLYDVLEAEGGVGASQ